MGYLNNSTRTLDAILTKKGREILSSGGNFEVTKFALGDDEIDYALWDTAHTRGTDYYGAVIDNLPALEPFNDPSEIMKYKLVTRNDSCRAMIELTDGGGTQNGFNNLVYFKNAGAGDPGAKRAQVGTDPAAIGVNTYVGGGDAGGDQFTNVGLAIGRNPNSEFVGQVEFDLLADEEFTVTLLDSSIAILAPAHDADRIIHPESTTFTNDVFQPTVNDSLWIPFVDNVQHISQTVSKCVIGDSGFLNFPVLGTGAMTNIRLYPKSITEGPTQTSVLVMGEKSGAVIEFAVEIAYDTTT